MEHIRSHATYLKTCYLIITYSAVFKDIEAIAVQHIIQNAYVYVANNNHEVKGLNWYRQWIDAPLICWNWTKQKQIQYIMGKMWQSKRELTLNFVIFAHFQHKCSQYRQLDMENWLLPSYESYYTEQESNLKQLWPFRLTEIFHIEKGDNS